MSETISIIVGIPPASQSPNARVHWTKKHKGKQAAQNETLLRLREAIPENQHWPRCKLEVVWYGKHHNVLRKDGDNTLATLKGHIDALQKHGLVKNDRDVVYMTPRYEVDKQNPRVVLTLTRLERE